MKEENNIVLIGKDELFRKGLVLILQSHLICKNIKEGDTYDMLIDAFASFDIDLLIIDLNIFKENTRNIQGRISENNLHVIILADEVDRGYVAKAMKAGVKGFLLKDIQEYALIKAIETVMDGGFFIDANATNELVVEYLDLSNNNPQLKLKRPHDVCTNREYEILLLIAEGKTNEEIARALDIKVKTVKHHVNSLLRKLNAKNRTQAVIFAYRNNWIEFANS